MKHMLVSTPSFPSDIRHLGEEGWAWASNRHQPTGRDVCLFLVGSFNNGIQWSTVCKQKLNIQMKQFFQKLIKLLKVCECYTFLAFFFSISIFMLIITYKDALALLTLFQCMHYHYELVKKCFKNKILEILSCFLLFLI